MVLTACFFGGIGLHFYEKFELFPQEMPFHFFPSNSDNCVQKVSEKLLNLLLLQQHVKQLPSPPINVGWLGFLELQVQVNSTLIWG